MARITPKLVRTIFKWTNACYCEALKDEYPEVFTKEADDEPEWNEREMKEILICKGLPFRSENINRKYLNYLKTLETFKLELVMQAHRKKRLRRSPVTIHAILDELFERSANSESKDKYEKT